MTQLTIDMARTLAREQWGPGDEVVVTRLDHDSNIRPWVLAAESVGATVRWLDFDPRTAEVDDIETVLTTRTRLVALTAASNLFGTRPDVAAVAGAAHEVGALVYVDGVHLTPHAPVDVAALGADFFACSPYKFFGPHLGVLVGRPGAARVAAPRQAAALHRRRAGALRARHAALRAAGRRHRRRRLHRRPGPGRRGRPARRVLASMAAVEAYEDVLLERLLDGLDAVAGVRLHGRPARRTPTALFSVDGRTGARGARAPGRAGRQRAGEPLLRARGLAAGWASATTARSGPGSRRTPPPTTSTGWWRASPGSLGRPDNLVLRAHRHLERQLPPLAASTASRRSSSATTSTCSRCRRPRRARTSCR